MRPRTHTQYTCRECVIGRRSSSQRLYMAYGTRFAAHIADVHVLFIRSFVRRFLYRCCCCDVRRFNNNISIKWNPRLFCIYCVDWFVSQSTWHAIDGNRIIVFHRTHRIFGRRQTQIGHETRRFSDSVRLHNKLNSTLFCLIIIFLFSSIQFMFIFIIIFRQIITRQTKRNTMIECCTCEKTYNCLNAKRKYDYLFAK